MSPPLRLREHLGREVQGLQEPKDGEECGAELSSGYDIVIGIINTQHCGLQNGEGGKGKKRGGVAERQTDRHSPLTASWSAQI